MNRSRQCTQNKLRQKFEIYERARRDFYRSCRLSEEACEALLAIDRKEFKSFAREVSRRVDENVEDLPATESKKEYEGDEWICEIENARLVEALARLTESETDLLGDCVVRGLTQREMAKKHNMSQSSVSRRMRKIFSSLRLAATTSEEENDKEEK